MIFDTAKQAKAKVSQNYRTQLRCGDCKHMRFREVACGSQSFMPEYRCRLGDFEVEPSAVCDKFKDAP